MANFEKQVNRIKIPGTTPVELPPFRENVGHIAYMPLELRERIPEIGNPYTTIGLASAALYNVNSFAEQAINLQPGQNTQVDMNTLSNFREAIFYSWVNEDRERDAFDAQGYSWGDKTLTDTNIDPYNAIVEKLEIAGAPDYKELVTSHDLWTKGDFWDYATPEYELAVGGLKAFFYMRGDLPNSEIDDTPEHFLGVAVYAPVVE